MARTILIFKLDPVGAGPRNCPHKISVFDIAPRTSSFAFGTSGRGLPPSWGPFQAARSGPHRIDRHEYWQLYPLTIEISTSVSILWVPDIVCSRRRRTAPRRRRKIWRATGPGRLSSLAAWGRARSATHHGLSSSARRCHPSLHVIDHVEWLQALATGRASVTHCRGGYVLSASPGTLAVAALFGGLIGGLFEGGGRARRSSRRGRPRLTAYPIHPTHRGTMFPPPHGSTAGHFPVASLYRPVFRL